MEILNIRTYGPAGPRDAEVTEVLTRSDKVRIERIISRGQCSPEGFWYDQDYDEWVMLVEGKARLLFEADGRRVELNSGDYLNIPKHMRHRVEWTSPDVPTIWLAVFY